MTTLPLGAWHRLERSSAAMGAQRSAAWWTLVLLCLGSALLGRLVYLLQVFDADGAMFIYMGKLTSEGGRLCHDLIDNKFPTVGLVTSVPWRMFGANWPGYVLLGAVLSFAGALLLGRIAQRHIGRHAVLPVTLFALVYLNFNPAVFGGFQLETLQVFFAILAAGAATEALKHRDCRCALVVGLAAGCSGMLKPTGLAVAGAFGLTLIMAHRRQPKRLAALVGMMLLGLSIPAGTVLVYLIGADLLRDMPALAAQISTYANASAWNWHDLFKPPTVAVLLGLPFLVRGWIFRRLVHRVDVPVDRAMLGFFAVWLVMEAIGIASQRRMYAYHFLVLAPPAALLFGLIPRRSELKPLAAALVPVIVLSICGSAAVFQSTQTTPARLPASAYLLAHAQPGEAVWQDGLMRLLIETNLRPGSRVPMSFLFANHDEAPLDYSAIMLDDFARAQPKYILLRTDFDEWVSHQTRHIAELDRVPRRRENFIAAWRRIRHYVESHYQPEAQIDREMVWRRRD